jgi:hypothetical protein
MVHTVDEATYQNLLRMAGGEKKLPQYVAAVLQQHAQSTPNNR